MTDGRNTRTAPGNAASPLAAVQETIAEYPQTFVYTITFGDGANQEAMVEIAEAGNGQHFHADNADSLVDIFQQLAAAAGVTIIE